MGMQTAKRPVRAVVECSYLDREFNPQPGLIVQQQGWLSHIVDRVTGEEIIAVPRDLIGGVS